MAERNQQSPATKVQVDPNGLRAFAQALSTEATTVTALGSGDAFTAAASALPGTDFGPVAEKVNDAVHRCLERIATRLTTVADAVHDAAGRYELTEDDFAAKLRAIGLHLS